MKQLFFKSFILNSSFYHIDKDLTNNFTELIRYQTYWKRSPYKIHLHLCKNLQTSHLCLKILNLTPSLARGVYRIKGWKIPQAEGHQPVHSLPLHLNSDTAENSERGNRVGCPGWDRTMCGGFAVSCRIGWLISHSHDYIDETECIYIRARTAPRVSDWVQYLENKKLSSSTLSTLSSWFFPSLFIFHTIFLILAAITHR